MARAEITVVVTLAWWWRYVYWPLLLIYAACGFPINMGLVLADLERAVRFRVMR